MRAIVFEEFGGRLDVRDVREPTAEAGDVLVRVHAAGICRSDWHGWMGHDPDLHELPHVPGHEFAGEVVELGTGVSRALLGKRVTVPFVAGCGSCATCTAGDPQVCPQQSQPGFTHWGAFAELVRVRYADANLVTLPDEMKFVTAASLGCRFTTAYRAVIAHGRAARGEWVAVHGCGGVGLSAVMIAASVGARVLAVDVDPAALDLAREFGAEGTLLFEPGRATESEAIAALVDATDGGAQLSIDALGNAGILYRSVSSLRRRGRHVQVGLLVGEESNAGVPMDRVIARELELYGSHGMQASQFPPLFEAIATGSMDPARLVTRRCNLAEGAERLAVLDLEPHAGVTVIDSFVN